MNFWRTFWAVFIALYAMEEIKRYRQARERYKYSPESYPEVHV